MTLDQIKQTGIDALSRDLGVVGMIRFLQQSETGWGDYTKDRDQWLGDPELKNLVDAIRGREAAG